MLDRVTTAFELVGIVALTLAASLATYLRYGLVWALVTLALACFLWSAVLGQLRGTAREPKPEPTLWADGGDVT